jgi:hypothetical protein
LLPPRRIGAQDQPIGIGLPDRHTPVDSAYAVVSAADPQASCAEFHEFIASWKDEGILTCKYIRIGHIASHLSASTEGIMRTYSQPLTTPQTVDRRMLGVLRKKGALSMEGLSTLTGIGWAQVFMSVDRLSRIGKVSLTPVRPCEYRISIAGLLRR